MPNVKVELNHEVINGQPITFIAPCDSSEVTGLKVSWPGGAKEFTFKDSHGNDLTGISELFLEGAYVRVIVDTEKSNAFIQNADTNAYLESRINKASPVNLLDNSDFRNPVNQRGLTSYTTTSTTHCIDRWKIYSGTVDISESGIAVSNFLRQKIPALRDGTYTLSAQKSDGTIYVRNMIIENGNVTAYSGTSEVYVVKDGDLYVAGINAGSWVWAALYEGEYTADTLPEYRPKGFAHELMECRRYYENSWITKGRSERQEYFAFPYSATQADGRVPYCVPKRTKPTVAFYPYGDVYATWALYNDSTYAEAGEISAQNRNGLEALVFRVTKSGADTTTWAIGKAMQAHGHWEASADL